MARGFGRIVRGIGAAGLVLLATLALAEGLMRVFRPPPVVQVVRLVERPESRWPEWDPAVPYWETATDRQNEACGQARPDAARVLVLGDSTFFGYELAAEDVFTRGLQRVLDQRFPDAAPCVMNYAQSAFSGQQMLELARVLVPRLRPDLLVWQVAWSSGATYGKAGDDAYMLDRHVLDADGYPSAFRLPGAWNAWLFRNSRLFEYMTLALALGPTPPPERQWLPVTTGRLRAVRDLAAAHGTRLLLVASPSLDRPFDEAAGPSRGMERDVRAVAGELGVPAVLLAERLAGQDVEALRLDPCCHFNARGHQVLAQVLLEDVLGNLPGEAPPPAPDTANP